MGLFKTKGQKKREQGLNYYNQDLQEKKPRDPKSDRAVFAEVSFEDAVKAGCPAALMDLVRLYEAGYEGQEGLTHILSLSQAAMVHDVPGAAGALGRCYFKGYGTRADRGKAFSYLSQADREGDTYAGVQLYLASCHYHGWGRPKNEAEARRRLETLESCPGYDLFEDEALALWAEIQRLAPAPAAQPAVSTRRAAAAAQTAPARRQGRLCRAGISVLLWRAAHGSGTGPQARAGLRAAGRAGRPDGPGADPVPQLW